MSTQIKQWCDAILFHEDDLELGTCKTLKMITDEANRLTAEISRLQAESERLQETVRKLQQKFPVVISRARQSGYTSAYLHREEGYNFGKEQQRLRQEDNVTFTAEIMKLEGQLHTAEQEIEKLKDPKITLNYKTSEYPFNVAGCHIADRSHSENSLSICSEEIDEVICTAEQRVAREMAKLFLGENWEKVCQCIEGWTCPMCTIKEKYHFKGV